MNAARIIFGIIYLLGAPFNIFMVVTQGWQAYIVKGDVGSKTIYESTVMNQIEFF